MFDVIEINIFVLDIRMIYYIKDYDIDVNMLSEKCTYVFIIVLEDY